MAFRFLQPAAFRPIPVSTLLLALAVLVAAQIAFCRSGFGEPGSAASGEYSGRGHREFGPAAADEDAGAYLKELFAIINMARYRSSLPVLLPDQALSGAAAEVVRTSIQRAGGLAPADLPPVELTAPLARFGIRGRLVQGLQAHFNIPVDQLVNGFLSDPKEREQLLHRGYGFIGGAVQNLPNGNRYLVIMLSTDAVNMDGYRLEIFRVVNSIRIQRGLPALAWDNGAARAAQIRAAEAAKRFEHFRPSGAHWSTILKELDIRAIEAGENLAHGQKDPAEVMGALMESSGHRDNILGASYNKIGVGCQVGDDGQLNCAQVFLRQ